jgi:hypothetical protein
MTNKRYNLMLSEKDWEYLGKIAKLMGQTRSQMIRETVEQMTGTLRKAFGEDIEVEKMDIAQYYRVMMLETAAALGTLAETKPEPEKKSKKSS